jgi:hypothetical protein
MKNKQKEGHPKRQGIFTSEMKIKGTVSTDYWGI